MRISDWSSDVCYSDLAATGTGRAAQLLLAVRGAVAAIRPCLVIGGGKARSSDAMVTLGWIPDRPLSAIPAFAGMADRETASGRQPTHGRHSTARSEAHV